jgi:transglutaminase-like putative cysteine protease/uncharacterized protein (DUF58 family)
LKTSRRGRLRPPRRLSVTREGKWFLALTFGVGLAAVNTGNNLLYIVLSANLSIVVLSGFLSEATLRGLRVRVSPPAEAFAGQEALLAVACAAPAGRRFPSFSIDVAFRVGETPVSARMPDAAAGAESVRVVTFRPDRRGNREISGLVVSTRFPFALFRKSMDPPSPAPVLVFPAPGTPARDAAQGGREAEADDRPDGRGKGAGIRGVRDYAPGDPARDIQWKASARLGRRMVKEREGDRAGLLEIRIPAGEAGPAFERSVSRACGDVLRCERAGIGYRISHAGRVAVDGTVRGARSAALRFLATVPPTLAEPAPAGRRVPPPVPAANPGQAAFPGNQGGALRLLPRLFWGSGLLWLADAGVPWPVLAVAALSLAIGIAIESGALSVRLGRGLEPALGAFVSLAAVAAFFLGGRDLLGAGALLVLGIQSIRFLLPKRAADCWQLTALTFLEYLAAAAGGGDLLFALIAAAFLLLFPGAMWSHHEARRFEEGAPQRPVPPRFAAALLLAVAGAGVVLTAFLFTVTPRFRVGHLSRKSPAARKTVGFSDTISLRDISNFASDRRIAARVDFPGMDGIPAIAESYMRGATYSVFTGSEWRKEGAPLTSIPRVGTGYILAPQPRVGTLLEAEITLEPLDSPAFFTYGTPVSAEGALGNLRADPDGNLLLPYSDHPAIRYRIRFFPGPIAPSRLFPPPRDADRAMPPGDWSAVAALAGEVAPPGDGDAARARKLAAHLRSSYRYTINGSARDIRDFLFVRKAGYCEHFATALCLMLRASGIPARAAAGYMGGEWNEVGNYLIVRQSDAHAWTEAWIGGRWVTLDATPAARGERATAALTAGKGEKVLDWLEHQWDRYVVDYDLAAQAKGVSVIREAVRRIPESAIGLRGKAGTGQAAALAAAGLLALFLWHRRAAGRGRRPAGGDAPLPAPYARLFETLARGGWRASPGIPPAEMLSKAVAGRPDLSADAARFTALYHRDRFGPAPLPAEARAEALRLAERLRAALPRAGAE